MSDQEKQNSDQERREFFRIDDRVNLSYQIVSEEELAKRIKALECSPSDGLTVMTRLTSISQQLAATLHRIDQQNPDVADYLKSLDQKLEVLAQTFLSRNSDLVEQPAQMVNLSAGGIAFSVVDEIEQGTPLEVKLLLSPTYTGILTYGRIVSCDPTEDEEDDSYQVRVDFEHIRDSDRDALIRHILRRQGEHLRREREEREAE